MVRVAILKKGICTAIVLGGDDWSDHYPEGVVSETANVGDVWDGNAFSRPAAPAPGTAELEAYAAERRWQAETGGIRIDGLRVATDDRSKTLITGARIKADQDPAHTLRFKVGGPFVTLTAPQIIAISDAVFAHTQASFDAEADVQAAILTGTVTSFADIDAWPWPGVFGESAHGG